MKQKFTPFQLLFRIICVVLVVGIDSKSDKLTLSSRKIASSIPKRNQSFNHFSSRHSSIAFTFSPFERIKNDFLALTRRVTARHILIPKSMDAALALKQNIRNRVYTGRKEDDEEEKMYVEDAFVAAAKRYSQDEETSSRGGLLGTLVPQGYCRAPELDRACFEVPLGQIAGPIESNYGYHLILVTERTNCPKLDGKYTRIVRDGKRAVFTTNSEIPTVAEETAQVALTQVAFWIITSLAGGLLAEVAAKAAGVMETLPWEETIPFE